MNTLFRQLTSDVMIFLCVAIPLRAYAQEAQAPLTIAVVRGEGEVIDGKHTVNIIVRTSPPGASVTFKLPAGAGVSFSGGASQIRLNSDAQGIAESGMISATRKGSPLDVEVTANFQGLSANTIVHIRNEWLGNGTTVPTHKSRTMLWIGIIGGGVAGVVLAAAGKGSSSGSNSSSGSTTTVTVGSPTVGGPQ